MVVLVVVKMEPNRIVAAAWFTPPIEGMVKLINKAEIPMMNPQVTKMRPFQRCHCRWRA